MMGKVESQSDLLQRLHCQAQNRRQFVGWGAGGLGAFFMNTAYAAQQPATSEQPK